MNGFIKVFWHSGAAIFWVGVVALSFAYIVFTVMASGCSMDEVEELYSPGGDYRAYVIMSGCGGFSSPQTQIYVERVKNRPSSFFNKTETEALIRLEGRPDKIDYKISWKSNGEFVISGFDFNKIMSFENKSWGPHLPRVYFEIAGS